MSLLPSSPLYLPTQMPSSNSNIALHILATFLLAIDTGLILTVITQMWVAS
jgi:hypothetical protein